MAFISSSGMVGKRCSLVLSLSDTKKAIFYCFLHLLNDVIDVQ